MKALILITFSLLTATVTASGQDKSKILINYNPSPIEKSLIYDQYTLADTFKYKKTVRYIQWDKIKDKLSAIDQIQEKDVAWGIFQNRQNVNGRPTAVKDAGINMYKRTVDRFGIEQNQGIPLYLSDDSKTPDRYAIDGWLAEIVDSDDSLKVYFVESPYIEGEWSVPHKYIKPIEKGTKFTKVVLVDRTMQAIVTAEKSGGKWLIRSINPTTTGVTNPPYKMPTPLGIFATQEQKRKMFYLKDGTSEIEGYAPWATRFSNGAYLHGVPVNGINASEVEWSPTLGTIPRSHKCVRNATSHAKFMYDWLPLNESLVVVFD